MYHIASRISCTAEYIFYGLASITEHFTNIVALFMLETNDVIIHA